MIVTNRPITHTIRPRSCRNSYLLPILDNHPDPFTVFAFFFLPRDLLLLPTLSPVPWMDRYGIYRRIVLYR